MAKRNPTGATETHRATVDAREELKHTLERDTAVQGEREEESATASQSPAGADSAPPAAPNRAPGDRKKPGA